ncbi:MAG: response regulator [bacterium]|nr:response regulator [bacterium]
MLIIDEDAAMCEMLVEVLREQGFESSYAVDVDRALGMLDCEPFGAVVCAAQMSPRSGLEFLDVVSGSEKAPPVIMMTDVGTPDTAGTPGAAGAFAFLKKPFLPSQLSELVERAINV